MPMYRIQVDGIVKKKLSKTLKFSIKDVLLLGQGEMSQNVLDMEHMYHKHENPFDNDDYNQYYFTMLNQRSLHDYITKDVGVWWDYLFFAVGKLNDDKKK